MATATAAVTLAVHAGPTRPVPLPGTISRRLRSVRVTETDGERSVFSLTFDAGIAPAGAPGPPALSDGPLTYGCRVSLVVTLGSVPTVLADGIVTEVDLWYADRAGGSSMNITAEDVSLLLDRSERDVARPAQSDYAQAQAILGPYAAQGILARLSRPTTMDTPSPSDRVPTQHDTDLGHLSRLARRNGFVCYMIPGPAVGASTFYWGPPVRTGGPQRALSVNLGAHTNVEGTPRFRGTALSPVAVAGSIQDPRSGGTVGVQASISGWPPLAAEPLSRLRTAVRRTRRLRLSGPDPGTAQSRAQAEVDRSIDAVTGTGALDGGRYGAVLRPRGLVGVRGAGWAHDGLWYVRQVVHDFDRGSYRQSFTIVREGYGPTVPAVPG